MLICESELKLDVADEPLVEEEEEEEEEEEDPPCNPRQMLPVSVISYLPKTNEWHFFIWHEHDIFKGFLGGTWK